MTTATAGRMSSSSATAGASTATTAGAWWTVAFGLAGKYCIRIRDINTGVDAAQDRLVALLTGT